MRVSVAASSGQVLVQSTDEQTTLPMIGAARGPVGVQSLDGDWILGLIHNAIDVAYAQKKTNAAREMLLDPSHLNRLLNADGHLSVRKLGLLGEPFWRAFIDELRAHFKLDSDEDRLRRALDARAAADSVIDEIARKGLR